MRAYGWQTNANRYRTEIIEQSACRDTAEPLGKEPDWIEDVNKPTEPSFFTNMSDSLIEAVNVLECGQIEDEEYYNNSRDSLLPA